MAYGEACATINDDSVTTGGNDAQIGLPELGKCSWPNRIDVGELHICVPKQALGTQMPNRPERSD